MRTRFIHAGLLLGLASMIPSSESDAGTVTTTFQVTANVDASCSIFASDLAFGSYNENAVSPLDSQSNVSVDCTNGSNWDLGLDKGLHGASVSARAMANNFSSSVHMNYSLFQDPARTVNWGDTPGVDTITGTGTGVADTIGVYGRVPEGQTTVTAGGYADTITATLTF